MYTSKFVLQMFVILFAVENVQFSFTQKCAQLTITELRQAHSTNFPITSFPNSGGLGKWRKLQIENANSTLTSIRVATGCLLRLCYLKTLTQWKYQRCENYVGNWNSEEINSTEVYCLKIDKLFKHLAMYAYLTFRCQTGKKTLL